MLDLFSGSGSKNELALIPSAIKVLRSKSASWSQRGRRKTQTNKEEEAFGLRFEVRGGLLWLHAVKDRRTKVDVNDTEQIHDMEGDAHKEDEGDLLPKLWPLWCHL